MIFPKRIRLLLIPVPALLALMLLFDACGSEDGRKRPDVSGIPVSVHIRRFDKALFAIDTNNVGAGLAALRQEYPDFTEIFVKQLLQVDPPVSDEQKVEGFVRFPPIRKLYDTCMVVYSDLSDIEGELSQAFRYYKYYFPGRQEPELLSFLSEYTVATPVFGDSAHTSIGIGLDLFLGPDYPAYEGIFPAYIRRTLDKKHLSAKVVEALATDLAGPAAGQRLLDLMIHNGKILYLKDLMLPDAPDSIKMEYTQKQVEWCRDNELNIWSHFLSEKLLYSTQLDKIQKLVNPSPNAPGMPPEAPGRTANWIGWQIVKAYMNRNQGVSVETLLATRDAQLILDQSRYKPRR